VSNTKTKLQTILTAQAFHMKDYYHSHYTC
jgi:hypothetical protein